jgi:hypothetical protein
VDDKLSKEAFLEMQIKKGFADILLKESCNEEEMVEYLNRRSFKGIDKDILMDKFEDFTQINIEPSINDTKDVFLIFEDMKTLLELSRAKRFDVPYKVMKRVWAQFNIYMKPQMLIEKWKLEGKKNAEIEKLEEEIAKIRGNQVNYEEEETQIDMDYYDPNVPRRIIQGKEKEVEQNQIVVYESTPEFYKKEDFYVNHEENYYKLEEQEEQPEVDFSEKIEKFDVSSMDEVNEFLTNTHIGPDFDIKKERKERVNQVEVDRSFLEDLLQSGTFKDVGPIEQSKIFNALELKQLARDTSTSRMKQYLLMYKVAETKLEKEFCLQKLRKELISYGKFNMKIIKTSDKYNNFDLFVDALAKEMEMETRNDESEMAQLVRRILDREYMPNSAHSQFKAFMEEQLLKTNDKYQAYEVEFEVDQKESDNLQLSTKKLKELMGTSDNANIQNFLNKLKMAYLGEWSDKGKWKGFC